MLVTLDSLANNPDSSVFVETIDHLSINSWTNTFYLFYISDLSNSSPDSVEEVKFRARYNHFVIGVEIVARKGEGGYGITMTLPSGELGIGYSDKADYFTASHCVNGEFSPSFLGTLTDSSASKVEYTPIAFNSPKTLEIKLPQTFKMKKETVQAINRFSEEIVKRSENALDRHKNFKVPGSQGRRNR